MCAAMPIGANAATVGLLSCSVHVCGYPMCMNVYVNPPMCALLVAKWTYNQADRPIRVYTMIAKTMLSTQCVHFYILCYHNNKTHPAPSEAFATTKVPILRNPALSFLMRREYHNKNFPKCLPGISVGLRLQ